MNAVSARPRHDRADLRRLAEFGYEPVRWRRPPTGATRRAVIVLCEPAPAKGLLADLLRGLSLAGHPLRQHPPTSAGTFDHKSLIVRFDAMAGGRGTEPAHDQASGTVALPPVSELHGNPAAKRAAWAVLRAALRQG